MGSLSRTNGQMLHLWVRDRGKKRKDLAAPKVVGKMSRKSWVCQCPKRTVRYVHDQTTVELEKTQTHSLSVEPPPVTTLFSCKSLIEQCHMTRTLTRTISMFTRKIHMTNSWKYANIISVQFIPLPRMWGRGKQKEIKRFKKKVILAKEMQPVARASIRIHE